MKTTSTLAALAAGLASVANAHYTFDQAVLNDVLVGRANTYIRRHQNGYMPTKFFQAPEGSISPVDKDFTCNKGAVAASDVLTVKPGDKVGLKQAYGGTGMEHPGPTQVYVSPAAGGAKAYDGSGLWYKIHHALVCDQGSAEGLRTTRWCSWGEDRVWATIPATLPNGEYLLRGEHVGLHGAHDRTQSEYYYACLQIKVEGSTATSIPGQGVPIPGVYKITDPAPNFSVWGRSASFDVIFGPGVIPGGTIRGSNSGVTGDTIITVPADNSPVTPPPSSAPAPPPPAPTSTSVAAPPLAPTTLSTIAAPPPQSAPPPPPPVATPAPPPPVETPATPPAPPTPTRTPGTPPAPPTPTGTPTAKPTGRPRPTRTRTRRPRPTKKPCPAYDY